MYHFCSLFVFFGDKVFFFLLLLCIGLCLMVFVEHGRGKCKEPCFYTNVHVFVCSTGEECFSLSVL